MALTKHVSPDGTTERLDPNAGLLRRGSTEDSGELQEGYMAVNSEHLIEAVRRSACVGPTKVVRSNEVEERDRYRYQWRREDRQRIISDRMELFIALAIGLGMGLLPEGVQGICASTLTGALVWFMTGLFRNQYSP